MKRKRLNRPYIPRKEYRFWLRADREGEAQLMDYIAFLKQSRQFVTYVKRGLRLLGTLSEGDLSYLFELFPQLVERLNPPPTPAPPDNADLQRLIETSVQSSVTQAIMNMPSLPAGPLVGAPLKSSGTLGKGVQFTPAPGEDDDDGDTIVLTKSTQTTRPTAFENLIAGMLEMDERADRAYAENLATGNVDPRTGRRKQTVQPRLD